MANDELKYNEPSTGTNIATQSFSEDGNTRHHQRFVTGYQPFDMINAHYFENDEGASQKILPSRDMNCASNWTESGSGTSEYYFDMSGGVSEAQVIQIFENNSEMSIGILGSLSAGEWAVGDNDTIGSNAIYVRMTDSVDPDTKATGYLTCAFAYPCSGASKVVCLPVFSTASATAKVRPILFADDLRQQYSDTSRVTAPIILDEVDLADINIDMGDAAYKNFAPSFSFETMGAKHYALLLTTAQSAGDLEFYGGTV